MHRPAREDAESSLPPRPVNRAWGQRSCRRVSTRAGQSSGLVRAMAADRGGEFSTPAATALFSG